jgi:hypothetical protein
MSWHLKRRRNNCPSQLLFPSVNQAKPPVIRRLGLTKEKHYEMDHLNGVLICDYGKNLQNEKAQNDRYQGMDL